MVLRRITRAAFSVAYTFWVWVPKVVQLRSYAYLSRHSRMMMSISKPELVRWQKSVGRTEAKSLRSGMRDMKEAITMLRHLLSPHRPHWPLISITLSLTSRKYSHRGVPCRGGLACGCGGGGAVLHPQRGSHGVMHEQIDDVRGCDIHRPALGKNNVIDKNHCAMDAPYAGLPLHSNRSPSVSAGGNHSTSRSVDECGPQIAPMQWDTAFLLL